jgi:biotin synthase
VRTIAVARITMPKARALSAGRRQMGEAVQAMCFLAGANSIFYGDKLLTTDNPEANDDRVCWKTGPENPRRGPGIGTEGKCGC